MGKHAQAKWWLELAIEMNLKTANAATVGPEARAACVRRSEQLKASRDALCRDEQRVPFPQAVELDL